MTHYNVSRSRISATQWVRPESIFRCSRIPKHWQSGSTSAEPQAPTTAGVAAAAPIPAEVPRAPTQVGLPHLASRGSDSSPSRRRRPSPGPIDHLGTSDWWAQGPGPPGPKGPYRRPVRNPSTPARPPPTHSQTAEPTVSFALQSPSPKDFPATGTKQAVIPIHTPNLARASSVTGVNRLTRFPSGSRKSHFGVHRRGRRRLPLFGNGSAEPAANRSDRLVTADGKCPDLRRNLGEQCVPPHRGDFGDHLIKVDEPVDVGGDDAGRNQLHGNLPVGRSGIARRAAPSGRQARQPLRQPTPPYRTSDDGNRASGLGNMRWNVVRLTKGCSPDAMECK